MSLSYSSNNGITSYVKALTVSAAVLSLKMMTVHVLTVRERIMARCVLFDRVRCCCCFCCCFSASEA